MIPMYSNEHDCPWLNYKNAIKSDVRHLLKGDFTDLPKVSNYQLRELNELLEYLNYSLPEGSYDLSLARLRDEAWKQYFNSVADNSEQYQAAFAKYTSKLDKDFTDFEIVSDPFNLFPDMVGKKYNKFKDLHAELKELFEWDDFMNIRMYVLEEINYIPRIEEEDDIYKGVAFIKAMMDVKINVRKDSVAYVSNYMVLANIEHKRRKNETNKRKNKKSKA